MGEERNEYKALEGKGPLGRRRWEVNVKKCIKDK
jgi:hypothetical protein